MVPEFITSIFFIAIVILLVGNLVSIVTNFFYPPLKQYVMPLTKSNICHCELWHTKCEFTVGWHVDHDTRYYQNHEIAKAFSSIERSVHTFKDTMWLDSNKVATAEQILLHALKKMDVEVILAEEAKLAVRKEVLSCLMYVSTCLKNSWPLLAPKLEPSRFFVQQFCQNLKGKKNLFYTVVENQHSLLEYLTYIFNIHSNFIRVVRIIEKYYLQISKKDRPKLLSDINIIQNVLKENNFKGDINLMSTISKNLGVKRFVAIDTEMVGAGCNGQINMAAKVSLVDKKCCIYNKFVKPVQRVTDLRTFVSGIHAEDLIGGEDFDTVQKEVRSLINDRILVGHDLEKDLKVLGLTHPVKDIRDTALYKPFRIVPHEKPSLRYLARTKLGRDIQNGHHDSVEDACAAMDLYLAVAEEWEEWN